MNPDETSGHYNTIKARTNLENREEYSRIVMYLLAIIGATIIGGSCVAGIDSFARMAVFNGGLAITILSGIMLIATGASHGHLVVFRIVETRTDELSDKLDRGIEVGAHNGEILGDVLEDELRRRRPS